jgi:hypothetical protein
MMLVNKPSLLLTRSRLTDDLVGRPLTGTFLFLTVSDHLQPLFGDSVGVFVVLLLFAVLQTAPASDM